MFQDTPYTSPEWLLAIYIPPISVARLPFLHGRSCISGLDTIKLLKENIGRTLSDINHSKIFFDPSLRVMKITAKIHKWDLIKLKRFCTTKETINKKKRQPSEWEEIFTNEATDKGLISKIYKQLM